MAMQLFLILLRVVTLTSANELSLDLGGHSASAASEADDFGVEDAKGGGGIIALYDPVLRLNRHSFRENILENHGDEVTHWIVLFCASWHSPCQALEPIYRQLTLKWQDQLNNAVLSREVGFAAVDCATEKVLCNSQHVGMNYPLVAHYQQRKMVKAWKGKSFDTDAERLTNFLQSRLGAAASVSSTESGETSAEAAQDFPVDFLLIFAAIAGNAWFISRSGCSADASPGGGSNPAESAKRGSQAAIQASASTPHTEQRSSCSLRSPTSHEFHDSRTQEL